MSFECKVFPGVDCIGRGICEAEVMELDEGYNGIEDDEQEEEDERPRDDR